MLTMTRMHALIHGKVQGVFFRANMQQVAKSLGFTGWVRNLPDGRVEALLEGEESKMAAMKDWLWKGSPRALVQDVELIEEVYRGDYTDFTIRY